MKLLAAIVVVVALGAGAGVGGWYVQEVLFGTLSVTPGPDWSSDAMRERTIKGLRAQLGNESATSKLSLKEIEGLRSRLAELEKGN